MVRVLCRKTTLVACVVLVLGLVFAAAGCSGSAESATTASPAASDTTASSAATQSSTSAEVSASGSETLLMYAGAASKPPTEEAIQLFKEKTGITIEVVFGGSGKVLSEMKLVKEGDLYFPGSSDYMEKAKKDGDVIADTEAIITYLVPAINVQAGNPHNIKTLKDLTRPGIKVAIANPETVCVGLYAVEIIEQNLTADEKAAFKANLLNYTESCEKTATAISLKQVDAVIGWSVFQDWDPETIQTIPLEASQIPRVGYIPIAVASYTKKQAAAQQFIDFLTSAEGQAIFAKYGYFATPDQAIAYIGQEKPVGGEYTLPADWVAK
jgi:molybdate transport system substrate-binding protein